MSFMGKKYNLFMDSLYTIKKDTVAIDRKLITNDFEN